MRFRGQLGVVLLALGVGACGGDDDAGEDWTAIHEELPGALLSVWGSGPDDVWTVGGDPDQTTNTNGPEPALALRWDGAAWTELDPGVQGSLWWVFGFSGGPVFMGGEGAQIVRHDGAFTVMETPADTGTVFGIWGCAEDDLWAVGGNSFGGGGGFAWRYDGTSWAMAEGFPADEVADIAIWKVFGRACDDVMLVGTNGISLHWDGAGFTVENAGIGESLFTVHANQQRYVAVGGGGSGIVVEHDGTGWKDVSPDDASLLVGVCLTPDDEGVAVGAYGEVFMRAGSGWTRDATAPPIDAFYHAVWIDPDGGVWAVGGQTLSPPLDRGVMLYRGSQAPLGD